MTYLATAIGVCCAVGLNIASVVVDAPPLPTVPRPVVQPVAAHRSNAQPATIALLVGTGLALVAYASRNRRSIE